MDDGGFYKRETASDTTIKPFVTFDEAGEFHCSCGNYPNAQGAYPCDGEGTEIDENENWMNLWCCDRCGVVFDNTGEVVGQRKEE